ncbi:cation-dependent mannose-6-phosphate receptor-like [Acipenser oxyrinchus oxyrinchus]|uniref:Cation-dependent mannose-6-phosphate receptor n=1 Tax=Acipenser oxyrinchus oxyrinchus TaxID=40147 RepID=A0AAD8FZN5_ACIOX|nr:cation-dependent mannose-6-phosphate receptor-like [Acipenser oxyrinchus oxyrinchus]
MSVIGQLTWSALVLLFVPEWGRCQGQTGNCKLAIDKGKESETERKLLSKLEPLAPLSFSADTQDDDSFKYYFSVCGNAANTSNAGLVQIDKSGIKTIIGRYTETQIFGGSDWVILVYKNGSKYDNHCNNETRKSMVMISCNRNTIGDGFAVIDEERTKPTDCFYLFELDSSTVCPVITSKLNAGSILLIVFFSCLTLYIVGGFLYQRLVVGAKGMEQFPNYSFWQDLGNLTADGCDFICRSRARNAPPTYRGVASEPLGGEETEERDDHLLPM